MIEDEPAVIEADRETWRALTPAQREQLSREADRRHLQPALPSPALAMLAALQRQLAALTIERRASARVEQVASLLTQDQLAKALNCSVRTVFTLREQGCPHVMLLESPRFILADVIQWMENRTQERAA
ncbi:MAG TPA: hypothetical protein VER04_20335 [Polyangiaceae bacterium]|nr:hypothetical protein [Polyangiaceae bacterium]